MGCFNNSEDYKSIKSYLKENTSYSDKQIDNYIARKYLANNGIFASPEQSVAEINAICGGDKMRENAKKINSDNIEYFNSDKHLKKIESGLGTNVDDLTGQPIVKLESTDSNFKQNNQIYGRELYSSELNALVPNASKKLHSKKDRANFADQISKIADKFNVNIFHVNESEVWEKHKWICEDHQFIDFIQFYSKNGRFTGTVKQWEQWKKLYSDEDSVDKQYIKAQMDTEKKERVIRFAYYANKRGIKPTQRLASLYADPRNLESPYMTSEEREIITSIDAEDKYNQRCYQTVDDIIRSGSTVTLDDIPVADATKQKNLNFIDQMAKKLGLDYVFITQAEADKILSEHNVTAPKGSSFNINGKIYFVGDHISQDTAIHEFSHPFIATIKVENNTLFNKLYDELRNSAEWEQIERRLDTMYGSLEKDSDLYKEEALVIAIENLHAVSTEKTRNIFDKMIYALKRIFRKYFGNNINLSKLSLDTTMADLYDMLDADNTLDLTSGTMTDEDIVKFKKDELSLSAQVETFFFHYDPTLSQEMKLFEDTMYNYEEALKQHLRRAKTDKFLAEYYELSDEMIKQMLRDQQMATLEHKINMETSSNPIDELDTEDTQLAEVFRRRCEYFAHSIKNLTFVAQQIRDYVSAISKTEITEDDARQLYSYNMLVNHWLNFLEKFNENIAAATSKIGTDKYNPVILNDIISRTQLSLLSTKKLINDIYLDISVDTIYEKLAPTYEKLTRKFNNRLAKLSGASQGIKDDLYKQYYGLTESEYNEYKALENKSFKDDKDNARFDKLKLKSMKGLIKSKNDISYLILGEMGDANFLNSKMEGYLSNYDPIIQGMASFFKEKHENARNKTVNEFNDFQSKINTKLQKVNLSKAKIGSLGKMLGFKDIEYGVDENNNPIQVERWTFLNPFKNYKYDLRALEVDVENKLHTFKQTNKDEDEKEYLDAKEKLQLFKDMYMNQEYVPEYYAIRRKYLKTELGRKAIEKRDALNESIRQLEDQIRMEQGFSESYDHRMLLISELNMKRKELRQLASEIDSHGNRKENDELKIAQLLTNYNKEISKFYETEVDTETFDADFLAFRQSLLDNGIEEDSDEFNREIDMWLSQCTTYGTEPEYNIQRQALIQRIIELSEENPDVQQAWMDIFSIVNGAKDNMGHIAIGRLTDEQIDKIEELQRFIYGNSSEKSEELKEALAEYNALVEKIPSSYYLDMLSDAMEECGITIDVMKNDFGCNTIEEFAEYIAHEVPEQFDSYVSSIDSRYTFADFHRKTHFLTTIVSGGSATVQTHRYYQYNVTRPYDKTMESSHNIINPETGNIVMTVNGVPSGRYVRRRVKDEYRTKKIVGVTVDNKENFLPKNIDTLKHQEGLSDNANDENYRYKYINFDYYDMQKRNPELFDVLETFKEEYLKIQESASIKNRLYLQFPRYVKNNAEILGQSTTVGAKESMIQIGDRFMQFFKGAPDDYEEGIGDFVTYGAEKSFEDDIAGRIPVGGLYNVDADSCSTNIQHTMFRYAADVFNEEELIKNSYFFYALKQSLEANPIKSDKYDSNKLIATGVLDRLVPSKKKKNVRTEAYDNFLEKNYEGKLVKGTGEQHPFLMRLSKKLMGISSYAFFGFNLPSALKNSHGIDFQALVESSTAQYCSLASLAKAEPWALEAMCEMALSGNYSLGEKSLKRRIIEQFDIKQGDAMNNFADPLWRSVATDILNGKFVTAPRKWLEDQATFHAGAGILFFHNIGYFKDGNFTTINYMDSFEVRDGKLTIKNGADVRYAFEDTIYVPKEGDTARSILNSLGIKDDLFDDDYVNEKIANIRDAYEQYLQAVEYINTYSSNNIEKELAEAKKEYDKVVSRNSIRIKNTKYNEIRDNIHEVLNQLGGNYANLDQPDAQRYFLYQITFYLRRYVTPMFLKRFRIRRHVNIGLGDETQGYYFTAIETLWKIGKSMGEYAKYCSPDELKAMWKWFIESVLLVSIPYICLCLGYDDKDKDRYKKLRRMSGPLPFPGVKEDYSRRFDTGGWLTVHAIHLLKQIEYENTQFVPFLGGLKQIESLTDIKSVFVGPTLDQCTMILDDLREMISDDENSGRGYYTRDMGPYKWQKKGSPKLYNHFMKFMAITGSTVDPAMAIENLESQRAKVRR